MLEGRSNQDIAAEFKKWLDGALAGRSPEDRIDITEMLGQIIDLAELDAEQEWELPAV